MIIDYILYLRDEKPGKKLGKSSIKAHISAILYFFHINNDDFNLTLRKFNIHLPSDDRSVVNEDRPYTRDEIAQVIQKGCSSDLRSKVVIYLLCGSGLRMGAISSLRIEDLTPIPYKGLNVYKVKVYARTHDKYYTFTTIDSAKAIRDYLDYRERYGERITDKSPLIREQFNIGDRLRIENPRFVTDKAIEYLIDQVITRSGVRKPGVVHLSHGMRKYFISTCESSPMKSLHVSMLSGHSTGIKQHYHIPDESVLLEDFMTHAAADALTIDPTQRLKQENAELKKNQTDYLAELGDLRHDFDKMKQVLVHLSKGTQKELVDEFFEKVGDKADIEWSCD
jgi:integrase